VHCAQRLCCKEVVRLSVNRKFFFKIKKIVIFRFLSFLKFYIFPYFLYIERKRDKCMKGRVLVYKSYFIYIYIYIYS
jgi:hypothetical protein